METLKLNLGCANDMAIQKVEVDEPYEGRVTNLNMSITAIKK
jgi:hypothetical protein